MVVQLILGKRTFTPSISRAVLARAGSESKIKIIETLMLS